MEGFLLANSEISPEKIRAYRDTQYCVGQDSDPLVLRIDIRSDELSRLYDWSGCSCGVFITALNPFGESQSTEENEAVHARLSNDLQTLAPGRVLEGTGSALNGDWPDEKSLFALGVDLAVAEELGIRYKQDAVVWVGDDRVPQLILLR